MPVTRLIVETTASASKYKNAFVVESEFMHGDDDFDAFRTTVFSADQQELVIEFLNFLDRTQAALDENEYQDSVDGYDKFGDDYADTFIIGLDGGWPIDCDNSIEASYEGSTVAFYDTNGTRFEVTVI
ncbi:hypothetical protein D3C75_745370 [compost metagenome]